MDLERPRTGPEIEHRNLYIEFEAKHNTVLVSIMSFFLYMALVTSATLRG